MLKDSDLYHNYTSHIYFNKSSLPKGTKTILKNSDGFPTLIEFGLGKGTVIASGLTWEHNYYRPNYNTYFAKKSYDDLMVYGLSKVAELEKEIDPSPIYKVNKSKASIFVGADAATPIKDASIYFGSTLIGKSDSKGILCFTGYDKQTVTYKVTCKGYKTKTGSMYIANGKIKAIYLDKSTASSGKPGISGLTMKLGSQPVVDVLASRLITKKNDATKTKFTIKYEKGDKTLKEFVFSQGTKTFTSKTATGEIELGKTFSPEAPIYAYMRFTDGTTSDKVKTGVFIKDASSGELDLWTSEQEGQFSIGDSSLYKVTVPGNLPIVGGTELKFGPSLPAYILVENKKIRIGFGISGNPFKKETDPEKKKDLFSQYEKKVDEACETLDRLDDLSERMKAFGGKAGGFTLAKGWDTPKFELAGYIEGTLDDNGKIATVGGKIIGSVEFKYQYNQQFLVGPVPVYCEITPSFKLELSAEVQHILMDSHEVSLSIPLTFTPGVTIGAGVGLNGLLSVGAEGSVKIPVTLDFPRDYYKISLTGSMKITAKELFVFEQTKEIAKGTWVIKEGNLGLSKFDKKSEVSSEYIADDCEIDYSASDDYKVIDRYYLNKESQWDGKAVANSRVPRVYSTTGDLEIPDEAVYEADIKSYVLPGTIPQLVKTSNTTMLIFQSDNGSNDPLNCVSLMYSIYDNGWSTPKEVWKNNGEGDFYAELICANDEIYVVWQKCAPVAENTATPDEDAVEEPEGEDTIEEPDDSEEIIAQPDTEEVVGEETIIEESLENESVEDEAVQEEVVYSEETESVQEFADAEAVLYEEVPAEDENVYEASDVVEIEENTSEEETIEEDIISEEWEIEDTLIEDTDISEEMTIEDEVTEETAAEEEKEQDEIAPEDGDDPSVDDLVAKMEIAYAKFDADTDLFTGEQYLTDNAYYDGTASVAVDSSDNISVVWLNNKTNTPMSGSANEVVVRTKSSNQSSFSSESVLFSTNSYISNIDAVYVGSDLKVVYGADDDANLQNQDDLRVYVYDGTTSNLISGTDAAATFIQVSDGYVYYLKAGVLYRYSLAEKTTEELAGTAGNCHVITDGATTSVLYMVPDEEKVSHFYSYDIVNNKAGKTSLIANVNGSVDSFGAVYNEDGSYKIIGAVRRGEGNSEYTSLVAFEPELTNDLVLTNVYAVDTDYNSSTKKQPITIDVSNDGKKTVDGFELNIYKGNSLIETKEFSNSLVTGASKSLKYSFSRESADQLEEYRFEVVAEDDFDTSNNSITHTLGYNDIAIDVVENYVGYDINLICQVSNLAARKCDATLKIREDSIDGDVILEKPITELAKGTSQVVNVTIDRRFIDYTPGKEKLYYISVETDDEVFTSDNVYALPVETLEKELTSIRIDGGKQVRSYDYDSVIGKSATLTASTVPANVSAKVKWSSSNSSVIKIDASTGKYTVKGAGEAVITAKADADITDTIKIVIVKYKKDKPTGVKATRDSQDGQKVIKISWNKLSGISNYEVYRSTSSGGTYTLAGRSSELYYVDNDCELGKTYYYKVRGYINSHGDYLRTKFSSIVNCKVTLDKPKLTVTSSGLTRIYLSGYFVSSAEKYEIYRSTSKTGTYKLLETTTSTYYYDNSITPSKTYYYKVRAVAGKSKSSYSSVVKCKAELSKPTSISAYLSSGEVYVSCGYVSGASGYEIYRSYTKNTDFVKIASGTSSATYDTGVAYGIPSYYKARAYCEYNGKKYYSGYSSVYSYTPTLSYSPYPQLSAAGNDRIAIKWSEQQGANGYYIYQANNYYSNGKKIKTVTDGTSCVVTNLKKNTTYYFYIVAFRKDSSGTHCASKSSTYSCTTGFGKPYNAKAVYNGSTIKVSFTKNGAASQTELYYYDSASGSYKTVRTKENSYTIKNVELGNSLTVSLRSVRKVNGSEEYSSYEYVYAYARSETPEKFGATSVDKGVKLTWKQLPYTKGYEIARSDSLYGVYSVIYTGNKKDIVSYTDTKVSSGNRYYYKIRSFYEKNGYTYYSSYSNITPVSYEAPTPLGIKAKASGTKVAITWNKPGSNKGYEVYRSTDSKSSFKKIKGTTKTSFTDSGLKKGKTYYYKIRSYTTLKGKKVYSPYSNTVKVVIKK